MKHVIFLCLLSLTLCLSKPADPEVPANHDVPKAAADAKVTPSVQPPVVTAQVPPKQNGTTELPANPSNISPAKEENQKSNKTAPIDSNKTTEKKEDSTTPNTKEETKVDKSTITADNSTHVTPAPNNPKPDEKGSKIETTIVPTTPPKPTEAPKTSAAPKDEGIHVVQARGFDGPSFIGGIILSLGLLAIGLIGFKYYKNQTERNYHTL